jgi:hypothetical protein
MNSHYPKLLLVIALIALTVLASCSRDEPTLVAPVVVVPGAIVMNDTYSRGTPGNLDWIELYNVGGTPVDLTGYKIYDSGGQTGVKSKKPIPAGTVVPAHGFYVVTTDTVSPGLSDDGFGLSSGGDEVWLENASGAVIDHVQIPAMETTQTYGRYPDGGSTWQLLNTITKGTSNKQ